MKRIVLPAAMSNSERARAMAVTEIAISSSMSHPNLVQTFTYSIRALGTEGDAISCSGPDLEDLSDSEVSLPTISSQLSGASSSRKSPSFIHAHEMRLVLEYCDKGSLSDYVKSRGGIRDPEGQLDYSAVLETAADVARAMIHLHLNNICHSDLKAGNVMLKSEAVDGRGVRAKVVDFGLSINLTNTMTHVSNIFQGTTSHMAPEVLMEGKQSKAADVYGECRCLDVMLISS